MPAVVSVEINLANVVDDSGDEGQGPAMAEVFFTPRLVMRKSVAQGFVPDPAPPSVA